MLCIAPRCVVAFALLTASVCLTAAPEDICRHPPVYQLYADGKPSQAYVVGSIHSGANPAAKFVERLVHADSELYVESMSFGPRATPSERNVRARIYKNFKVEDESRWPELERELDQLSLLQLFFTISQSIYQMPETNGLEVLASQAIPDKSRIYGLESPDDRDDLVRTFDDDAWVAAFDGLTALAAEPVRVAQVKALESRLISAVLAGSNKDAEQTLRAIDDLTPQLRPFREHFILGRDGLLAEKILQRVKLDRHQVFMVGAAHLLSGGLKAAAEAHMGPRYTLRSVCIPLQ